MAGAAQRAIHDRFPMAQIIGASGGGQFMRSALDDSEAIGIVVEFRKAYTRIACAPAGGMAQSRSCGQALAQALSKPDLKAVFVLSEGVDVAAGELAKGLRNGLDDDVEVIGGISGDDFTRKNAVIVINDSVKSAHVAAIGFYGHTLSVKSAFATGWTPIGIAKTITRSDGALVYELNGQPALDIYQRYTFPEDTLDAGRATRFVSFRLVNPDAPDDEIIRIVTGIDHEARALRFAGDMPQGWEAQLVRGSLPALVNEVAAAVRRCEVADATDEAMTLIVSCVGRKFLMGQHIIDEISAIHDNAGPKTAVAGFYSYGEFVRANKRRTLDLQNQVIALMTLREKQEIFGASPV